MSPEEQRQRASLLFEMDGAAYACAGCLLALIDNGIITAPTAVRNAAKFAELVAAYRATNIIDDARRVTP